jgi:hypothetical protein
MARWYEAANEAAFKRVTEGYLFQSPNPWLLARPRYYMVNETQKAEILTHLGRWRLFLIVIVLAMFAFLGFFMAFATLSPAAFLRFVRPAYDLGTGVFAALVAVPLILPVAAAQIYLHRRLRTVLQHAPQTTERITMREQLRTISETISSKVLLVGLIGGVGMMGSASYITIADYLDGHLFRNATFSFLLFVPGGLIAIYFVYLTRLRLRSKHIAA